MTCPELPLWFIGLAVFGAVSLVSLVLWFVLEAAIENNKRQQITHAGQIKRGIFK